MDKKVLGMAGLLVAVLVGAFFLTQQPASTPTTQTASHSASQNEGQSDSSTQTKPVTIGLLQLVSHPALDEIVAGFTEEMHALGYQEGQNYHLDHHNVAGDHSRLATIAEKFVADKHQLLVGITTPDVQALANATKEIPIVMGAVTAPAEAGLIVSDEQPGGNVTGVSDRVSPDKMVDVIKQVLGEKNRLAVLYTSSEDNAVAQATAFETVAVAQGFVVTRYTVTQATDLSLVAEQAAAANDAVFVPIDNTIAAAMPALIHVTDAKKIPVFVSADTMVKDGGLLALGVNQRHLGVLAARVADQILRGADPATMPITVSEAVAIQLNTKKATELGIELPQSLVDQAVIVTPEEE